SERKASFLQRSASIASLVAWRGRFQGKLSKRANFKSYISGHEGENEVQETTLRNDDPTSFPEDKPSHHQCEATSPNKKEVSCTDKDCTELENYFKKKLPITTRSSCNVSREDQRKMRKSVYKWMNDLPEENNLEEFLEAYGIPVEGVDMEEFKRRLKTFLEERLSRVAPSTPTPSETGFLYYKLTTKHVEETTTEQQWHPERQLKVLGELAHEDNLEKWLESLDVPFFGSIPETKEEIRKYLKRNPDQSVVIPAPTPLQDKVVVPKWQELVENMRGLKNEDELEKWLDSLEVPHNVPTAKVKEEIKKFFMHETYDNFPDAGLLKQVAVIAGTTAALGVLAVVSTTLLSFAMPAAVVFGTPYFVEVFAQYFLQRQEVCFSLLNFHTQNAKPLSTAWAKQYILWKYC
ncbi:hypothetical protein Ocin01_13295, partial [Orchesella cincta]